MRAIIPCSGFGTRMNMKPNESKEMLEDKIFDCKHIIDYSLKQCKFFNLNPLVITRKDKKDLIKYLKQNKIEYMIYEPKPEEEWYHSVLASKDHWEENNLLILPDTRFNSIFCIEDIERGLKLGNNAVMALHEVADPSKWGIILNRGYTLLEKPKNFKGDKFWAWGLIGFKHTYGQELFSSVKCLELTNVGFVYLKSFQDITRGK